MLTAFNPAAFIFSRMSGHREGTGRRKVWNSPDLYSVQHHRSYAEDTDVPEEYALSPDKETVLRTT